ncbi:hypothetical protein ACFL2V_13730 [Pseudomonadota bacterium]
MNLRQKLTILSISLPLVFFGLLSTPQPTKAQNSCGLALVTQDRNHVTIKADINAPGFYPATLYWGDDSTLRLRSGNNQHIYHAFGYTPGGSANYNITLKVPGISDCQLKIYINDGSSSGGAYCNLYLVELGKNQLTVGADVSGSGSWPGHLNWGDGSFIDLINGRGHHRHHSYSYNSGGTTEYDLYLSVPGVEACRTKFTIRDTNNSSSSLDSTSPHGALGCPGGTGSRTGIHPGNYNPKDLNQDQRQDLYELFGNSGTAPIGYGGQDCS